ncbi:MAG TPA: DeoR/GlpR family DNA-binding transcription regulator [Puia sp.]|jgi:DeoR/GlpR family transcriptional regulator of sugar metabolism
MLKQERQAYILHQIDLHNQVLSANLSSDLSVSEDTVRRDLQELADGGKIIKVHGGALSLSFNDFNSPSRHIYAHAQKKLIAKKAIQLIGKDMFVMTTGGTTLIELAKALPQSLKATFISGSIPVVMEYTYHPNIDVILIGDKVSKNSKITVGGDAITRIRQIKADICFLGVNAIDAEHGITDNDWDVVQIKKAMIESSQKVICLSIAEKINTFQPILVSPVEDIDVLITELPPDHPLLEPYRKKGITIL